MIVIRLPVTYTKARAALAECARVDECQKWADKAEALRAYAKQMKDGKLEADAVRIRDRAIQRGGQLLKQVKSNSGRGGRPKKNRAPGGPISSNGAAKAAGISPRQAKTMVQVASVPEEKFEELVEGSNPPSAKKLAELGTKPRDKPVEPEPYRNEWIDWTSAVRNLSALPACGLDVLAKRNRDAIQSLLESAIAAETNIQEWIAQLRSVT